MPLIPILYFQTNNFNFNPDHRLRNRKRETYSVYHTLQTREISMANNYGKHKSQLLTFRNLNWNKEKYLRFILQKSKK